MSVMPPRCAPQPVVRSAVGVLLAMLTGVLLALCAAGGTAAAAGHAAPEPRTALGSGPATVLPDASPALEAPRAPEAAPVSLPAPVLRGSAAVPAPWASWDSGDGDASHCAKRPAIPEASVRTAGGGTDPVGDAAGPAPEPALLRPYGPAPGTGQRGGPAPPSPGLHQLSVLRI